MKISELIKELESSIEESGDLEVRVKWGESAALLDSHGISTQHVGSPRNLCLIIDAD